MSFGFDCCCPCRICSDNDYKNLYTPQNFIITFKYSKLFLNNKISISNRNDSSEFCSDCDEKIVDTSTILYYQKGVVPGDVLPSLKKYSAIICVWDSEPVYNICGYDWKIRLCSYYVPLYVDHNLVPYASAFFIDFIDPSLPPENAIYYFPFANNEITAQMGAEGMGRRLFYEYVGYGYYFYDWWYMIASQESPLKNCTGDVAVYGNSFVVYSASSSPFYHTYIPYGCNINKYEGTIQGS